MSERQTTVWSVWKRLNFGECVRQTSLFVISEPKCSDEEFLCDFSEFQCVSKLFVCDGVQDCRSGADESECGKSDNRFYSSLSLVLLLLQNVII